MAEETKPTETEEQRAARMEAEAAAKEEARLAAEEMKALEAESARIASVLSKGEAGMAPMATLPARAPVVAPPAAPVVTQIPKGRGYLGPMITQPQFDQLPANTITNRAGPPPVLRPDQQAAIQQRMASGTSGAIIPGLTSRNPGEERFAAIQLINRKVQSGMPRQQAVQEAVMTFGPGLFGSGPAAKPMTAYETERIQMAKDAAAQKKIDSANKANNFNLKDDPDYMSLVSRENALYNALEKAMTPFDKGQIARQLKVVENEKAFLMQKLNPSRAAMTARSVVEPPAGTKTATARALTKELARDFMKRAGGVRVKAEALARAAGYEF